MVGVAGRSKACGNCRKRHIRCDEKKPKCGRCIKAKLECDGYRDLTVIQFSAPSNAIARRKSPTTTQSITVVGASTNSLVNFSILSPWNSLAIDLDEVFKTYTNERLLRGTETVHESAMTVHRKLADQCFLALATSYFGHDHRQKGLVEKGLTRYGNALSELHTALSRSDLSYDILESVILMTLFETVISTNKDGWVAHSLGMQRLFELRGPESFQKMPDRAVFQISRPTIIFASLVIRQPTILARQEWKEVPWALEPHEKVLYHHLVDICADCPGLLRMKDAALEIADDQERIDAVGLFVFEVKACLEQLAAWKQKWDTKEPNSCTEVPTTDDAPLCSSVPTRAWTTEYTYPNIYHASSLSLYHATFIHLRRMMHNVAHSLNTFDLWDSQAEEYVSGIEICRSVNYHLHKAREGEGSFSFMFPLRMAWEAVHELDKNVASWVEGVLHTISTGQRGKWAVAGYLLDTDEIPQGPPKKT